MHIESFRAYCLSLDGSHESTPFDLDTLVFKVKNKMFALTSISLFDRVNLKCDPEYAIELREENPSILPGFHMNKKHWNSIVIDGSVSDTLIYALIYHSYALVIKGLPKSQRDELHLLDT